MREVRYAPPAVGPQEAAAVAEVIRAGRLVSGDSVSRFEAAFRKRLGAEACMAVSSCTAAMHLALMANGVGHGDEVVTTPLSFCATANVIEHVGATTVFADVDAKTMNMDPAAFEAALTDRTRAVIPLHFGGIPCAMDEIRRIATDAGIDVVEDAAHAVAARSGGRSVGAGPNAACFSFHETKNLTTGEGGMLVGGRDLVARARPLAVHGMDGDRDAYDVPVPGWKYNMTDVQAAMGLVQLTRLDALQARRRAVWEAYDAAFRRVDALEVPFVPHGMEPSMHMYLLRLTEAAAVRRDDVRRSLHEAGVETSVHYVPIHTFSYYRRRYGHRPEAFPVALSTYRRMFGIPMHPGLDDADVSHVIDSVLVAVGER